METFFLVYYCTIFAKIIMLRQLNYNLLASMRLIKPSIKLPQVYQRSANSITYSNLQP